MIGICGGVGPAAGVLLHQAILQHTDSHGIDQGHLPVCHLSRSADVSSRAEFLARLKTTDKDDEKLENPASGMARTFERMQRIVAADNEALVVGIPCITFHVRPIWDEFRRLVDLNDDGRCRGAANVRCLHMLQETASFLAETAPHARRVGVMCTNGSRDARIFNDLLEPLGYEVLEVPADTQQELHDTILNPEWGIKSNAPVIQPRCAANFHRYARMLIDAGSDAIILGCTEIPLVFNGLTSLDGVMLVDPIVALARALIRGSDPSRLRPFDIGGVRDDACP
ncbi:hypothetical protein PINS_up009645 [Pythium insidiosum]|nr:hypothetical protein PINS_up009645 [Pythium insidiosum]